jgi:hypothetical protein
MIFEVIGAIEDVELIASGSGIRNRAYLKKLYGGARWRKMRGAGRVRLPTGEVRFVELHRYEAHGLGRKELKIKRYLD